MNNKQEKQLGLWALIKCKDQVNINISIIMRERIFKRGFNAKKQFLKDFSLTNQTVKALKSINSLFFQVSKLRFKNFVGSWKQYSLQELYAKSKAGRTSNTSISKYYWKDILFLSIKDITKANGYIKKQQSLFQKLVYKTVACELFLLVQ